MRRKAPNAKTLVLVEPHLREFGGHHPEDVVAICRAAKQVGLDTRVIGHRGLEPDLRAFLRAAAGVEVVAGIETRDLSETGFAALRWARASTRLVRALWSVLQGCESPAVVCIYNGNESLLFGSVFVALTMSKPDKLVFQLFRGRSWREDVSAKPTHRLLQTIRHLTRTASGYAIASDRLRIAGQTAPVARELSTHLGVETLALPLPIDWAILGSIREPSSTPPRVGFVGDTREEKGFSIFVEATDLICEPHQLESHANVRATDSRRRRRDLQAVSSLESRPDSTVHRGFVTREEYVSILRRLDLVVLPYDAELYAARSSRICAEALGLGIPVVVPDATALGELVTTRGVGVVFRSGSPSSLGASIDRALRQIDTLGQRCREQASRWRSEHCASSFVEQLVAK